MNEQLQPKQGHPSKSDLILLLTMLIICAMFIYWVVFTDEILVNYRRPTKDYFYAVLIAYLCGFIILMFILGTMGFTKFFRKRRFRSIPAWFRWLLEYFRKLAQSLRSSRSLKLLVLALVIYMLFFNSLKSRYLSKNTFDSSQNKTKVQSLPGIEYRAGQDRLPKIMLQSQKIIKNYPEVDVNVEILYELVEDYFNVNVEIYDEIGIEPFKPNRSNLFGGGQKSREVRSLDSLQGQARHDFIIEQYSEALELAFAYLEKKMLERKK